MGTSFDDEGSGVTTDSSGNIYVTGKTGATSWTGGLNNPAYAYLYVGLDGNTSSGGFDIFLVKYNSDGVKQ